MTGKTFTTVVASLAALAFASACGDGSTPVTPGGAAAVVTGTSTVTYSGQGLIADGQGGFALRTEICGLQNGADAEGPYLLWVLTATGANSAQLTGPWGTVPMVRSGNGTFKYVSGWYDPNALGTVSATYDGKVKNAQLVISHGCRPFADRGAWCSPGFWSNATDAAWALTGHAKTDPFNTTVYDAWYGGTFAANPTLYTVVNTANVYSGPPWAGTSGYALNAFNATGAFLTNDIPGYDFSLAVMQSGSSDACPIDHFGHFKQPQ
jgi:hypothetical protein